MKKIILTSLLIVITNISFAQSHNITSAAIILKQYNSEKDKSIQATKIKEAQGFIDEAYVNENTSNEPKMWMYRAKIYREIALKHDSLDSEAIFKATESHLKCMQPHPKKKNKIMIYKKWPKEEVLEGLVSCGYKLFNFATKEYNAGDFANSLRHYEAIYDIMPFDEEDQLKRGNITKETVLYRSSLSTIKMQDNSKTKEILQDLIDMNFNEPRIYINMSNIFQEENNIDKALEYLSLGREMFEEDPGLINAEINLYIQLGRTSELIGIFSEAINLDDENDLLYFNRGTLYDQEGDFINAEKDYKASLEINPVAFGSNYNLGALYFNTGVETNNKANNTSNNNLHNKLKKEAEISFAKALPYLEKAHALDSKDKNTLLSLKQLYYLNGNYKRSEEMKKLIKNLN
tara:strand:- start:7312 stop:8523 length:1212 start_codon:yes stop_codon:yes gene_type:complete